MLSDHPAYATLPSPDIQVLRRFYEDVLGFVPRDENPSGIFYHAGDSTFFIITRSSGKASGGHTQLGFRVSDIVSEVADLRARRHLRGAGDPKDHRRNRDDPDRACRLVP